MKKILLTLLMLALVLSVVALTVAAAPELGVDEAGKLTGTESGKTYEYAKVTFLPTVTVGEYADYTDGTALAAGVYSVREKGATDAATVWVKGANYGTISFVSDATETAGTWTFLRFISIW